MVDGIPRHINDVRKIVLEKKCNDTNKLLPLKHIESSSECENTENDEGVLRRSTRIRRLPNRYF